MRVIVSLAGGSKSHYQNPDGTFSLDMWKARIDRYVGMTLEPFVSDGTIIAHYMIDEPKSPSSWGGEVVPNRSWMRWPDTARSTGPGLKTVVRAEPTKLEREVHTWRFLDAAWAQYSARKGPVEDYAVVEALSAREHGLG